jgi:hypothetical protein
MTERISDERLARMIEMASADTEIIGDRRNHRGSQYRYTVDVEAALRELQRLREQVQALRPHSKWLRHASAEIARDGYAGWGNTCSYAADAMDRLIGPLPGGDA